MPSASSPRPAPASRAAASVDPRVADPGQATVSGGYFIDVGGWSYFAVSDVNTPSDDDADIDIIYLFR